MSELDDYYRSSEQARLDSFRLRDEEMRAAWIKIIHLLLPLRLEQYIQNKDPHYMWVNVHGTDVVTWPLVRALEYDLPCINLFQDGRLGIVTNWYGKHGNLAEFRTPEELDLRSLEEVANSVLTIGSSVEIASNFHCFLRQHWDRPWAEEQRRQASRLLP